MSRRALVIPVHQCAGEQRDDEIDRHGHGDDLDRLAGLAEARAGEHREQVRIADRNGERGVLGEVEVLVGQRRHDDPQRLRHRDETQGQSAAHAKRHCRLRLAARNREQAGAHDLGNEGGGVGGQRDKQCDKLREESNAADEVEAAQLRTLEADRKAGRDEGDERQADDETQARPARREAAARALLPAPRPYPQRDSRDDGEHQGPEDPAGPLPDHRRGHDDAAVVEKSRAQEREALARSGQRAEDGEIPEQNLEEDRKVADQLDIAGRQLGQQPVRREPRDADQEAEDRREHDANARDQQRVQEPDDEDAGIGVGFIVGDQRLVDAEAGGRIQESETAADVLGREIGARVERELIAEPCRRAQQDDLVGQRADLRIVVERNPRRRLLQGRIRNGSHRTFAVSGQVVPRCSLGSTATNVRCRRSCSPRPISRYPRSALRSAGQRTACCDHRVSSTFDSR